MIGSGLQNFPETLFRSGIISGREGGNGAVKYLHR